MDAGGAGYRWVEFSQFKQHTHTHTSYGANTITTVFSLGGETTRPLRMLSRHRALNHACSLARNGSKQTCSVYIASVSAVFRLLTT